MIQSGGRSSAIKPLLCLAGFTLVGIFLSPEAAQIFGLPLKGILVCIFAAISLVALISYLILIFKDPRLLQSEHYQLAMRRMDIAAQQLGRAPDYHISDNASQAILLDGERETTVDVGTRLERVEDGAYPSETTDTEESK